MAAMVKMTVRINYAQRYIAMAFGMLVVSLPVVASVYAARIPDLGR